MVITEIRIFTELTGETVELSVVKRIWQLIVEVINVIAEFISCNPFELIQNVINKNNQSRERRSLTG